jgi:hypothetical protein
MKVTNEEVSELVLCGICVFWLHCFRLVLHLADWANLCFSAVEGFAMLAIAATSTRYCGLSFH